MLSTSKNEILKDLKDFENRGYKERLLKLYRRLPKMECKGCGVCCYDSPVTSYAEFLFAFDYFNDDNNFSYEDRLKIYKKAFKENIIGLISKEVSCAFLSEDNRCLIHERAPLSCKLWGTKTEEEYVRDVDKDHDRNKDYKEHLAKLGVNMPDEVVNYKTPNCDNVKIISNPYNLSNREFDSIILNDILKVNFPYRKKNAPDWTIGCYLLYYIFGDVILKERINIVRDYQSGNVNAVEEFINKIDFSKYI